MSLSRSAAIVVATLWMIGFLMPYHCLADNYVYSYWLLDHPDGSTHYQLTVSVTPSLYEYYSSENHNMPLHELAKFVTPNALEPIAEKLWNIYDDEEDFANGVLMILHQIQYVESDPKYPVETIVHNQGDCDTFSYMAASIMKAGGLDVVLLYYETESHMNVGVYLSQPPEDARATIYYYSYQGRQYYVAECTGGDWQNGWRVGESPDEFKDASASIITLENCEQQSPGQVSSSYSSATSSSLSLTLSSTFMLQTNTVTISGSISPVCSDRNVTIYIRSYGSSWSVLNTVMTDTAGRYSYVWEPNSAGLFYIRASWSGDSEYVGADSNIHTLTIISTYWLLLGITAIVLIGVVIVMVLLTRQARPTAEVQPSPEDFDS